MINTYEQSVTTMTHCWLALGWKPTVWVHWVCSHSTFFLRQHGSIHCFTSIPTENRHQLRPNFFVCCKFRWSLLLRHFLISLTKKIFSYKFNDFCSFFGLTLPFKHDLRHAFSGWKLSNPRLASSYLCTVVNMHALDQGLRILNQTETKHSGFLYTGKTPMDLH